MLRLRILGIGLIVLDRLGLVGRLVRLVAFGVRFILCRATSRGWLVLMRRLT